MKHGFFTRAAALVLALILALSCVSCAGGGSSVSSSGNGSASQQDSQIVLTDQAGREVVLDHPAQTVVSCYYITTYATISLGVQDRVVGLEKKADSRPIYQMAAPELLEKTAVGTLKELDVEAVAALKPELVILPQKLSDYTDALTQLGIPVLVVNPESHQELVEMLQLLGTALGVEDRAKQLTDYYQEQMDRMTQLTQDAEKPVVYMGSNSSYMSTAPAAMYQSSLIDIAGGINAAAHLDGDYWTEVSYEDILVMAPQVIVIPAAAEYTAQDVLSDPQLAAVPAVADGKVYQMPTGIEEWDSPIPSGILGTMWLTSVLHPDAYAFEDFVSDAQNFYQTFYGFELDASLITK